MDLHQHLQLSLVRRLARHFENRAEADGVGLVVSSFGPRPENVRMRTKTKVNRSVVLGARQWCWAVSFEEYRFNFPVQMSLFCYQPG